MLLLLLVASKRIMPKWIPLEKVAKLCIHTECKAQEDEEEIERGASRHGDYFESVDWWYKERRERLGV